MDAALSTPAPARRSIVTRFIDFVWMCIKWCFVLVLVAAVGGGYYYYHRLNDDIRSHAERLLADAYPDYEVEIGSARLVEGEGILIHDVSMSVPGQPEPWGEVIHVDEIMVTCPTEAESYLRGEFTVQNLLLRRPVLRATRRADGVWNTAQLLPLPQLGSSDAPKPTAEIVNGTLEFLDHTQSPASAVSLHSLQLTITPETPPGHEHGHLQVAGSASSEHFQRFEINGFINPAQPECAFTGNLAGIQLSPALWDALPSELAEISTAVGGLQGRGDLRFTVELASTAGATLQFSVSGTLTQGRWQDPRFTYPLSDLEARFTANNEGLQIEELTARSRQATLLLVLATEGYGQDCPWQMEGRVRQLPLDADLMAALPEKMQRSWQKFSPAGTVNADLRMAFDGQTYHPELAMECLGTSFAYYKFPYRMTNTTGLLHLVGDKLTANLTTHAGATPLIINGAIENPSTAPLGTVTIVSEGAVALDEDMIAVLNDNGKRFMRSLRAQGGVLVDYRLEYAGVKDQPPAQHLVMNVENCSLNHVAFPYPIDRVTGVIEQHNGEWTFHDFQGRNDSAVLNWEGQWQADPQSDTGLLHLDIVATDLPLEDELRDALSPKVADIWTEIRPRGTIDRLRASLDYELPAQKMTIEMQAQKWSRPEGGETGSISIEPVFLPYRIDNVTGSLRYREGRLELDDLRGKHGTVSLSTTGFCQSEAEGGWRARLDPLTIDCLQFDRGTLSALPEQLAAAVDKIALSGPMNISGAMEWSSPGTAQPVQTSWQIRMDMSDASLNVGVPLSHIYGGASLTGQYQENQFECRGELEIDSAMYNNLQLTRIGGPFWFDADQVLLGGWAERPEAGRSPRPVSMNLLGGAATLNAQIVSADPGVYSIQASLHNASFAQLVQRNAQAANLNGFVNGTLNLQGTREGVYTQRGSGQVQLREADLGELPLALALLKIVTAQSPDRSAFHGSDIDYRIEGEHIYLDRIDLLANAYTLKGRGEVNRQHEINLNFYTGVGPNNWSIPIVGTVARVASRQIMLIRATGTLEQPVVEPQVLPAVNDTLRRLFPAEFGEREAGDQGRLLPQR